MKQYFDLVAYLGGFMIGFAIIFVAWCVLIRLLIWPIGEAIKKKRTEKKFKHDLTDSKLEEFLDELE